MNRRQYFSIGSVCVIPGVAGCLSFFESEVQLASISAQNFADEERTIEVRVLDDGSEMQHSELRLDPAELGHERGRVTSGKKVDCEWDSEPRGYTVEARLDDEWESLDVASEADAECVFVVIDVEGSPGPDVRIRVHSCEDLDPDDEEFVCGFVDLG